MFIDPVSAMRLTFEATRIGINSQFVIGMRIAGMMGFWATEPAEITRMIAEKPRAAQQAFQAATRAAIRGESPDKVLSAGMKPIGKRASHNANRLKKRGPALP